MRTLDEPTSKGFGWEEETKQPIVVGCLYNDCTNELEKDPCQPGNGSMDGVQSNLGAFLPPSMDISNVTLEAASMSLFLFRISCFLKKN